MAAFLFYMVGFEVEKSGPYNFWNPVVLSVSDALYALPGCQSPIGVNQSAKPNF